MKKSLFICMAALMVSLTFLSSCSKDGEEDNVENYPSIIGSWSEFSDMSGEYVSGTIEVIWTFKTDNTATQQVILKMNGTTMRDKSNSFSYVYKGSTITLKGESRTFEYEISVSGNKMKLGNEEDGYFNLTKK